MRNYQQDPSSSSDAPFRFSDFARSSGRMLKEPEDYYVISWDTAVKTGSSNDFSVGAVFLVQYSYMPPGACTLREARFHLIDLFRGRVDYGALVEVMVEMHKRYRPRFTLVEETHLIEAIRHGL